MDKLMRYPPDCLAAGYGGQLGALEPHGDTGGWAVTCVPEDANWVAKFIEGLKAKTTAK